MSTLRYRQSVTPSKRSASPSNYCKPMNTETTKDSVAACCIQLEETQVARYLMGETDLSGCSSRRFRSLSGIGRQEKWRLHQKPPLEKLPVPPYCSVSLSIRSISGHRMARWSSFIRANSGSILLQKKNQQKNVPPLGKHTMCACKHQYNTTYGKQA